MQYAPAEYTANSKCSNKENIDPRLVPGQTEEQTDYRPGQCGGERARAGGSATNVGHIVDMACIVDTGRIRGGPLITRKWVLQLDLNLSSAVRGQRPQVNKRHTYIGCARAAAVTARGPVAVRTHRRFPPRPSPDRYSRFWLGASVYWQKARLCKGSQVSFMRVQCVNAFRMPLNVRSFYSTWDMFVDAHEIGFSAQGCYTTSTITIIISGR
ncbi:hypothetical protein EVAR_84409_1 [Eumeta japonica]|uniref:Uncharacterized protein n=1 Tax=Eumeta variegata TaxID=151549 RepID=A0A4C1YE23_EUMVA|nr:hypothetical protein EVAR_84409_1 [Eumeta japonica]